MGVLILLLIVTNPLHGIQVDTNSNSSDSPQSQSQTNFIPLKDGKPSADGCHEVTMPHGACRDKSSEESNKGSILHPDQPSCSCDDETADTATKVH